jgi:hypothetical protein
MRKSINDLDSMDWEVYLNGQRESLSVFADEEAGFILTHVLDSKNRICGSGAGPYYQAKRGEVELKRVSGQGECPKRIAKPPLGVKPEEFLELHRIQELSRAIYEYSTFQTDVERIDANLILKWHAELGKRLNSYAGLIDKG